MGPWFKARGPAPRTRTGHAVLTKEEHGGAMYTIKNYYAAYQSSVDTLTDFIENSTPVDGLKLFVEKNSLVAEKLDLLLRLRRLQISLI